MVYKNIRIPKKGGGSRLQRVQVLASGKYKFVKNLKSRVKKLTKKSKKRRKSTVARKRRSRGSKGFTLPLAVIGGIVASPAIREGITHGMQGNFEMALRSVGRIAGIDYNGNFNVSVLIPNLTPIIAGAVIHKFVGGKPLNLNAALARSGVPFIRI